MGVSVYVSASSTADQIERARVISTRLTAAGVHVVSHWIERVEANGGPLLANDAPWERRHSASAADLREVGACTVLWALCPPRIVYTRGLWVELGYALCLPARLCIASGDTKQSIFTSLCTEYATDDEAFDFVTSHNVLVQEHS